MRRRVFAACLLLVACETDPQGTAESVGDLRSPIIGGTLDSGDASVIELFYETSFLPSECGGLASCLQTCTFGDGGACTGGTGCTCGVAASCTGSLIGPRTVLTAGHCTDLSAGGEISRAGGPALTVCELASDVTAVTSGRPTSNGCNLAVFALFDNTCTTNTMQESCEVGLLRAGTYILGESVVNPGYAKNVAPPYTATNNDKDIGLVHLSSHLFANGGAEPPILTFNRQDLGPPCTDLGDLKFVGYGVTTPSSGMSGLSGVKYTVQHDVRVKDAWHTEEDGAQASPLSTCGAGTGVEPTCSGDSGGPSLNAQGLIVGVTSSGDPNCSSYGQDTRVDAYQSWIDSTMSGWGDTLNGSAAAADSGTTKGEGGTTPAHDAGATMVTEHTAATTDAGETADAGSDVAADDAGDADLAMLVPAATSGGSRGCSMSPSGEPFAWKNPLAFCFVLLAAVRRRR